MVNLSTEDKNRSLSIQRYGLFDFKLHILRTFVYLFEHLQFVLRKWCIIYARISQEKAPSYKSEIDQ